MDVIFPFVIAGMGTCFAGLIFDHITGLPVVKNIDELFIVMPTLLGLKGNLQLTLASRLSTQYQLGNVQQLSDILRLTSSNMALNQCFSIVISFSSAIFAIVIKSISIKAMLELDHCLLLICVSLVTSSAIGFALDILLIFIVQISSLSSVNPDNVAIPLISSLGDITALLSCSFLADAFFDIIKTDSFYWLTGTTILFYTCIMPCWIHMSIDNEQTKEVISRLSYWYPLLAAMALSSLAGFIFKTTVTFSDDIALFSPVICGVGGNLAAVQASRLSTMLHRNAQIGQLPENQSVCQCPWNLLISKASGYEVTRLLIALIVPGQIIFYFFCLWLDDRLNHVKMGFTIAYLLGCLVHGFTLIYLAYIFTYLMWINYIDPDSCAIPCLTSVGDVLGACIVTLFTWIVTYQRDQDKKT